MPKRKRAPQSTRDKRRKHQELQLRQKRWQSIRRKLAWVVPSIAFACSFPGFFSYLPHISISQAGNLNPNQPFGSIFQVTNNGFFPVMDVIGNCTIVKFGPNISNVGVTNAPPQMGDIDGGRTIALNCQNGFMTDQNEDGLEMEIDISYRPSLWPRRKVEKFSYVVVSSGNGFVWKPVNR